MTPGGYRWIYLDCVSDDGLTTLVLIVMLGNVFSPRYRAARRAGVAAPLSYSTFHVALGGARPRFALTETDRVERSADCLRVGESALEWTGTELRARIDERTALGRRVVGEVRLQLDQPLLRDEIALDAAGRHRWTPLAPVARAEVVLTSPALRFSGHAYLDGNEGDAALESGFSQWSWARLTTPQGRALIQYDTLERSGRRRQRTFQVVAGQLEPIDAPGLQVTPLPKTLFRLTPALRLDPGGLTVSKRMQDAPFYARAMVRGVALGEQVSGVHEWLDLDRFENPWVQRMIPYRMRNGFPRSEERRW